MLFPWSAATQRQTTPGQGGTAEEMGRKQPEQEKNPDTDNDEEVEDGEDEETLTQVCLDVCRDKRCGRLAPGKSSCPE